VKNALTASLLLLLAFSACPLTADDEVEKVTLELKSGETVSGALKDVTDAGVTLVGGDGVPLFLRWAFTRGDKHLELRKRACNYKSLSSVVSLADFCHDFALDRKEAECLIVALQIAPTDESLRTRLAALPKFKDLTAPETPGPEIKPPEKTPDTPPEKTPDKPPEKTPEPKNPDKPLVVKLECAETDAYATLSKELEKLGYKIASSKEKEFDVTVNIGLTFVLVKNPKWMGAELYAIYDGTCQYKISDKGAREPFEDKTVEAKNVRSNKTKVEAKALCLERLLERTVDALDRALKKRQ